MTIFNIIKKSIFQIRWDMNNGKTYQYGASISHREGIVSYSNPLMAQAVKIHTWYSQTNYGNLRFSPTLPLLKSGLEYVLLSKIDEIPKKSVFVQIDFFNIFDELIGNFTSNEEYLAFTYPKDAISYQISLVNASSDCLEFDSFILFEISGQKSNYYYDLNQKLLLTRSKISKFQSFEIFPQENQIITLREKNRLGIGDPFLTFSHINDMVLNDSFFPLDNLICFFKKINFKGQITGTDLFGSIVAILLHHKYKHIEIEVCDNFEKLLLNSSEFSDFVKKKIVNFQDH